MEFLKKLSLKTKVTIFISASFFLAFITIVIVVSLKNVDLDNKALELKAKNQATILLDLIDRNLFERNGDVKAFASNPLVAEILQNTDFTNENYNIVKALQDQLNKLTAYYECYDLMMICDINGKVLYTNSKDRNGNEVNFNDLKSENFANENWFKQAIKSNSNNFESNITKNTSIAKVCKNSGVGIEYSFAITNEYGDVVGVWYNFFNYNFVVDIMLEDLEKELQKSNDLASHLFLIHKSGKIISSTNKKLYENNVVVNILDFNKGNILSSEIPLLSKNYILQKGIHKSDKYQNSWDVVALIPKDVLSLTTFLDPYILGFFVLIIIFLIISNRLIKIIVDRILNVKSELQEVAKGNLLKIDEIKDDTNDEIKEMQLALLDLSNGLKEKQEFANAIGTGDFTINFHLKYENDNLGKSLIDMRNNLLAVSINDKKQNWVTQGLAKFVEILRSNNDENSVLYDRIIQNLVKYVKANQGGLFVISKDNEEKEYFELVACYAWDRKKYLHMKIGKGEGLVGQCWIEGEKVHLTEVPDNFVRITSGLGVANPKAILIMPLKLNDEIFGAIELASFQDFEEHEIQFIEKLSESIASTISAEKTNERTKKLLEESKKQQAEMEQQTEELRAQEEEMRQNMEEMQATQEEMEKAQAAMNELLESNRLKEKELESVNKEIQLKIANALAESKNYLEAIDSSLGTIEFDLTGNIINANQNFLDLVGYSLSEIIGKHHSMFLFEQEKNSDNYKVFWDNLGKGKSNKNIFCRKRKDNSELWIDAIYKVFKDKEGNPYKILKFAYDITEFKSK